MLFAPFTLVPKPVWSVSNRNLAQIGRALNAFTARPSLLSMTPLALAALKG